MKIKFSLAEFGEKRQNAGGNSVLNSLSRFEPTVSTAKNVFKKADFYLYTDFKNEETEYFEKNIGTVVYLEVDHLYSKSKRRGWRLSDLFKMKSLVDDNYDICITSDTDMIYSERSIKLVNCIDMFEFVLPINPRGIVANDCFGESNDGVYNPVLENDDSLGLFTTYNTTPMGFKTGSKKKVLVEKIIQNMEENPSRLPLAIWRAVKETKDYPYTLPNQWCVCNPDVPPNSLNPSKNPIILHAGHQKVLDAYNIKIQRRKNIPTDCKRHSKSL